MRKNLLLTRRIPFFLYACLSWGIGAWQTKPLKRIFVTNGNMLIRLSLLI
ncbi:hypothetical protein HDC90_000594 [Pedobacter sp. AK013]|nr:hypothetical protein [Pedobacter sp. AK013]MBB6235988.1 hypothetical protein [Pedobacter sp. AK013]